MTLNSVTFNQNGFGSGFDAFASVSVTVGASALAAQIPVMLMPDDFVVTPAGQLRLASAAEAIQQDILHFLQDQEDLGEPVTPVVQETVRSGIVNLLSDHPMVTSIDLVDVSGNEANQLLVSVFVNGASSPTAIGAL